MYRLIIVDDDELIRKGLEKVIQWEKLGFAVKGTYSNALDALEYLKEQETDVILTDIKMPQMSGLDLIDEAKKQYPSIKSVIISGYGEFELAKQALLLRVDNYLLKPLGEEEIEAAFGSLKQLLDKEQKTEYPEVKQQSKRKLAMLELLKNQIQELREDMIHSLESGAFRSLDVQIERIDRLLQRYDSEDKYYFYSDIILKILAYFELNQGEERYLLAHRPLSEYETCTMSSEQTKENFRKDLDKIQKVLWENSDSMRKLIVTKAKAMIEEEYADENLSLALVANRLNISYGYLSTIFTKTEGISFKTYLVDVRMKKARSFLLSRNYKIYEIAEQVGYKNPRYFTDAFKKYYQCSPQEYIARFRSGIEE